MLTLPRVSVLVLGGMVGIFLGFSWGILPTQAQVRTNTSALQVATPLAEPDPLASVSATVLPASPSALVEERREQKEDKDITQTSTQAIGKLARFLQETPAQPLSLTNFLQHAIRNGVERGIPANVLVLCLLFPVIASFVATSRHLIGLEGFGVYTPAVLAVALLSTGLVTGLFLFLVILGVVTLSRRILKLFHLQYLPRTAMLLWMVSLSVFGLILLGPQLLQMNIDLVTIGIFPILVLILLSENFVDALLSSSQSRAVELTLETVLMAVLSTVFLRTEVVQRFVVLNPEITILAVFCVNILVGRYTGLRLTEYLRFKPIFDAEE